MAVATRPGNGSGLVRGLLERVRLWWVMMAVFAVAVAVGGTGALVIFGFTGRGPIPF